MPGGQVLAPAFTYRETRRWGANPVVASWQVVMSGLFAGVGLAMLGIGGAVLAGARTSPYSTLFSILGFVAFVAVLQYLASHPATVHAWASRILTWYNDVRNRPKDAGQERLVRLIDQLGAVQLTRREAAIAFGWSLFNWIADVCCLLFACWAIGAHPSITGVAVAYAASTAVGTAIPLLPGGLGIVDAAMVAALVPAGMTTGDAVVAVILYRLVSWAIVSLIGWVVILVMFRTRFRSDIDHADDLEEGLRAGAPADPDRPLVGFSDGMRADSAALKRFLFKALYRHPRVMATTDDPLQLVIDGKAQAALAPALVPLMPSIASRPSSSSRSRTPQVKAPCEPPPCRATPIFFVTSSVARRVFGFVTVGAVPSPMRYARTPPHWLPATRDVSSISVMWY